jgi:hypothetical protein
MDEPLPKTIIYLKASEIKKLVKSKGKRSSKDFLLYLNGKVERIVTNYCNVLRGNKTLKAVDCMTLDEFNRRR